MSHSYDSNCPCEYCQTMKVIIDSYDSSKSEEAKNKKKFWENMYKNGYVEDPFPPRYFCRSCQLYHPEGYVHPRFEYKPPKMQQEPRTTFYKHQDGNFYQNTPPHPGKYRRHYDPAKDMMEWQYQPWKGGEWYTYFQASAEMLQRSVIDMGAKLTASKFHNAALHDLSKERYYKVERVDTPVKA